MHTPEQPSASNQAEEDSTVPFNIAFSYIWTTDEKAQFCQGVIVEPECLTDDEQTILEGEALEFLHGLPLIEVEDNYVSPRHKQGRKMIWTESSTKIFQAILNRAWADYQSNSTLINSATHVLELPSKTFVSPHKECQRCKGDVLMYINAIGTVVMRLLSKQDPRKMVDIILQSRSVLILKKEIQKGYVRQILNNINKKFNDFWYKKTNHLAIIMAYVYTDEKNNESCQQI